MILHNNDLEQYTQKVELLSSIWPATKMNELITRLILGTSGAAFQKLQLQRSDMMTGDQKGVERLVTILGGQWGKINLERKKLCSSVFNAKTKPTTPF